MPAWINRPQVTDHAPDHQRTICRHGDDRRRDARQRRARSRWRPCPSARRFRCPTSSSCSASCAGTAWSRASAARAAAIDLARGGRQRSRSPTSSSPSTSRSTPRNAAAARTARTTARCMTHELWASLNAHIFCFLRSVTLARARRAATRSPTSRCCRTTGTQAATPRTPEPADRLRRPMPDMPSRRTRLP